MRGKRVDRRRPALLYTYIYGETVRALFFICHEVGASPHRPPHAYTYIYGETTRALPCPIRGRMLLRPTPPVPIFRPSG